MSLRWPRARSLCLLRAWTCAEGLHAAEVWANLSRAGQARRLAWKRWRECGQRSRRQSEAPCRRA